MSEVYLRIGGKFGASTASYSVGTGCEMAGALNWPHISSTAKVKNEERYTSTPPYTQQQIYY